MQDFSSPLLCFPWTGKKLQKLIEAQQKDDTHRIRKQTWSDTTSYTMEMMQQERQSAPVYYEDETAIYDFKKETILKIIKALPRIDELSPREKVLYLASSIGGLTVRELEEVFKKPIKRSRISTILSDIKNDIQEDTEKVDNEKNFFRCNPRQKQGDFRAKYF